MRAFIAVDLNNEEVKQHILRIQRELDLSGAYIKSVEPWNLHFTLRFLGEIGEDEVKQVCKVLEEIEFFSFRVSFKGLGYFPHARRISVIWVGLDEGGDQFTNLAEMVELKLKQLHFKPEKKFLPHLTICRVKSGRNREQLLRAAEQHRDTKIGTDIVSSLKLKNSQLTPKGPIYTDVFEKIFKHC